MDWHFATLLLQSKTLKYHIMIVILNILALGLMVATIAVPATIIFNIYRATHEDRFC